MTKRKQQVARIALALVLLAAPAAAQTGNTAAVEKQLIANERAVNEAFATNDLEAQAKISSRNIDNMRVLGVSPGGAIAPPQKK